MYKSLVIVYSDSVSRNKDFFKIKYSGNIIGF